MKKTLAVKRIFKNEKDFCLEASVRRTEKDFCSKAGFLRMKKTLAVEQAFEDRVK